MNTLRTIQLLSRCYISRHSSRVGKSLWATIKNEPKKQCARSRDLLTHPQTRLYSTEFNRHFIKMKRMVSIFNKKPTVKIFKNQRNSFNNVQCENQRLQCRALIYINYLYYYLIERRRLYP
jgi:hypothetical protein